MDVDHDILQKRLSAEGVPLDNGEKHEVSSVLSWMSNSDFHTHCRQTLLDVKMDHRRIGSLLRP